MFYEEKIIDGILYFRTTKGGAWGAKNKRDALALQRTGKPPRSRSSIKPGPIDNLMEACRVSLGLDTKAEVLKLLGFDNATISRIRCGKLILTPRSILIIYDIVGISIEEIRHIGGVSKFTGQNKH